MPQAPSVGRFPVVLLEADVVLPRVDAAGLEALEVDVLHLVGRGLENDLELVVLEQPIRILAEPSVVGTPRGLDVGDAPVLRAEHAEQRLGMGRAGADFEIERLLEDAALGGPELRQLEDEILERQRFASASRSGATRAARRRSRRTRVDFSSRSRCRPMSRRCTVSSSASVSPLTSSAVTLPGRRPSRRAQKRERVRATGGAPARAPPARRPCR